MRLLGASSVLEARWAKRSIASGSTAKPNVACLRAIKRLCPTERPIKTLALKLASELSVSIKNGVSRRSFRRSFALSERRQAPPQTNSSELRASEQTVDREWREQETSRLNRPSAPARY